MDEEDDPFIFENERARLTGVPRPTWWRIEKEGKAPKRIKVTQRRVAWRLSEIRKWRRDPEHYQAAP